MRRVVVALLLLCALSTAQAELITFQFSGTVDSVQDPAGYLQGGVVPGSPFSGTYTFDSAATDTYPADPTVGRYVTTTGASLTTLVGTLTLSSPGPVAVVIGNGNSGDSYDAYTFPFVSSGLQIPELGIALTETTGGVFVSDELPLLPPDLTRFTTRRFSLQGRPVGATEYFFVTGTTTTLTPEPGSLALFSIGALLSARRRRRPLALLGLVPLFVAWATPLSAAPYCGTNESTRVPNAMHVVASEQRYAPDSPPGGEAVDIVFVIDGSDTIVSASGSFELEKAGIKNCFYGPAAFIPANGTVAIAVVRFEALKDRKDCQDGVLHVEKAILTAFAAAS